MILKKNPEGEQSSLPIDRDSEGMLGQEDNLILKIIN